MSFWDLNKDGKISNMEQAARLAYAASELERIKKSSGSSGARGARSSHKRRSDKPSKLDGAIEVIGLIAVALTVLALAMGLNMAFTDIDTSGMSYEEAMRAIDLKYMPTIVCASVCAASWIVELVLALLAPLFPAAGSDSDDGRTTEK